MKLGVLTVLFYSKTLEETLDFVKSCGLEAVELGTGNYPGNIHCNPDELLNDDGKLRHFQEQIANSGLMISALSCHGNPLHPQKDIARKFHDTWRKTVLLAEKLGISCINTFSGCPGDSEKAEQPNWVTCAWPPEYQEVLAWQWERQLVPYWQQEAAFAIQHGVQHIAFELHPGFMLYNPESLLKLRKLAGEAIGTNFDPSHLIWQGIDPVEAIKVLGKEQAIFHVHAKDTYLDRRNIAVNGVLDTKPYSQFLERSWSFRSVGYGMGETEWKRIISALRMVGYDYVVSIEHEDGLASPQEGFSKAVDCLQRCLLREPAAQMWWA